MPPAEREEEVRLARVAVVPVVVEVDGGEARREGDPRVELPVEPLRAPRVPLGHGRRVVGEARDPLGDGREGAAETDDARAREDGASVEVERVARGGDGLALVPQVVVGVGRGREQRGGEERGERPDDGARDRRENVPPTDVKNPSYFHKVVDCQWACPAHTNVPEYIRLIAQGRSPTRTC
jgi:hypothetical protein